MKHYSPQGKPELQEPRFINPELLLHPNIPKPMHGTNPRTILGDDWWNDVRQQAYAENNYCCWACGVHKSQAKYHQWLEAHERYRINYEHGIVSLVEITALCHSCHNFIHDGRMTSLVNKGEMSYDKMKEIHNHGYAVLAKAGIRNLRLDATLIAPWHKWHLVLNGKKYYSKFASYDEWMEYYS